MASLVNKLGINSITICFNLEVLAIVNEKSQSETAADLWEALQAGLVLPLSEAYKIPLVFTSDEMSREVKERIVPDSSLLSSSPASLPYRHNAPIAYKFLHDACAASGVFSYSGISVRTDPLENW